MWLPPNLHRGGGYMVEYYITLIYILFYALVGVSIITIALIIALAIIISK